MINWNLITARALFKKQLWDAIRVKDVEQFKNALHWLNYIDRCSQDELKQIITGIKILKFKEMG